MLRTYAFAASWEAVGDLMGTFSGFAFVLLVVILATLQLVKPLHRVKRQNSCLEEVRRLPSVPLQ